MTLQSAGCVLRNASLKKGKRAPLTLFIPGSEQAVSQQQHWEFRISTTCNYNSVQIYCSKGQKCIWKYPMTMKGLVP